MNVISVNNLIKTYKLYSSKKQRLLAAISPFGRKYHKDFHALNDVTFCIKKGETVGIIGQNGSGKSTLLKILTGVLTQNSGTVDVNGKISSLLELGAGFNPRLTGLENIYFNGTIMGYSRKEIEQKIPEIIKFADIGDYIYQPVKTYSSGMFVRLAFSVAINVDPEILIIDEALSVGDISFQMKCFEKFNKFKKEGKTIIFVTHALDQVLQYCDRGIVLNKGNVVCDDTPKEAVDIFKRIMVKCFEDNAKKYIDDTVILNNQYNKNMLRYGDNKAEIIEFNILDSKYRAVDKFINGEDFFIKFKIKFNESINFPVFAYTIKNNKGHEITGTNTQIEGVDTRTYINGDIVEVEFKQKMNLQSGGYALSLGCVSFQAEGLVVHDRLYDAILFESVNVKNFVGYFDLYSDVKVNKIC